MTIVLMTSYAYCYEKNSRLTNMIFEDVNDENIDIFSRMSFVEILNEYTKMMNDEDDFELLEDGNLLDGIREHFYRSRIPKKLYGHLFKRFGCSDASTGSSTSSSEDEAYHMIRRSDEECEMSGGVSEITTADDSSDGGNGKAIDALYRI